MSTEICLRPLRYIAITPVRDEEQYLRHTIRSMLRQTILPVQWILVDDGSSDRTLTIINGLSAQKSWITAVHRPDSSRDSRSGVSGTDDEPVSYRRGTRALQAKEIEAFYEGFEHITTTDWDFLVKLDGDVSFGAHYFERCFARFARDRDLGIGGGIICHRLEGRLQAEVTPRFHVRGATKIYRRACWHEIGGVVKGAGWDTLDEVKANMLGWRTRTFLHLPVIHHRYTGAANGAWRNALKNGLWNHVCGYHPLFVLAKCVKRMFWRAQMLHSTGLLWGFVLGRIRRVPQIEDKALIRFLQEQQLRRLLLRPTIWK